MKKFLVIFVSAVTILSVSIFGYAEQWSFPGEKESNANTPGFGDEPFASVLAISPGGSLQPFSGAGLAPFIPIQFNQFVISLLDARKSNSVFKFDEQPLISRLQVNTGIKTENYLSDPQSFLLDEFFDESADSFGIRSSVIFVGLGLDFDSFSLKGEAFVGRPLKTLFNKLQDAKSAERMQNQGVNADAHGFEASAGYQLSDMIALGAGFGKMTDKSKETDQSEEVYAVYAQAILAIAPGVQVKPEVGKVDRIKEETNTEEIDQSFYAGAIWEIKF